MKDTYDIEKDNKPDFYRGRIQELNNQISDLRSSLSGTTDEMMRWQKRFIDLAMSLGKDYKLDEGKVEVSDMVYDDRDGCNCSLCQEKVDPIMATPSGMRTECSDRRW